MPLFESRKSKNKQLFKGVFADVLHRFLNQISDEHEKQVYVGLLQGGAVAAELVVNYCESVKKAWGKGNEEKALALIKLFTLCMLSTWYRWLDEREQHTEDERTLAREMAASGILHLFGDDSKNAVADFLNMDGQYNYECDTSSRMPMLKMNGLILAKACEACGQPAINWSKVTFPVREWQEIVDSGAVINPSLFVNLREVVALGECRVTGVQMMSKYLKEYTSINMQPEQGDIG